MLVEELKELARSIQEQRAEEQKIEVKAAHIDCPKRLYDTLSSFSNQDTGGILIFGLDEKQDFKAVGVYDLQDLQKKVTEQCNQMEPPVRAVFTFAEYEGVWIVSAEIPSIDLTEHKLRNSTSHYEFEIRMIEGKSGDYYLLVKLNTIVDRRFSYREEFIPTSIKPVNAALLVELAKDYMIPDAQILDPFCGVGTMLIERQKVVKGNTSYGIDHSPEAIEKAIYNTNLADQIVHYINKDCFTFTHDYPFDEIFTEMPYATGQKTEAEIREVYEKFFPFAKRVLGPEGTIIMYTRNREYVKQFAVKSNFRILKEIKITQRPESYLMILK